MSLRLKSSVRPSVRDFIEQLAKLRFDGVFNPYADICPEHDKADAPAIAGGISRSHSKPPLIAVWSFCGLLVIWATVGGGGQASH